MPPTHYEIVGTSPSASAEQIRRAYLARARELHPDQFVGRPNEERARAERRMQELNASWSVLSDVEARRAYDAKLPRAAGGRGTGPMVSGRQGTWRPFDESSTRTPPRPKGPVVADERDMEIRGAARLLRPGRLLAIFGVLLGLIVLASIFNGGNGDSARVRNEPIAEPTGVPMGCISLIPVAESVPCGDHDAVVWSVVEAQEACPEDLEPVYRQGIGGLFCVTRVE